MKKRKVPKAIPILSTVPPLSTADEAELAHMNTADVARIAAAARKYDEDFDEDFD